MDAPAGLRFVESMECAVGGGDRAAAARYLTDDVIYVVGARPPLRGIDAVIASIAEQGRLARWDGHTPRAAWAGDGALVVEVESHFTRIADGRPISFPCTDIYRFRAARSATGGSTPTCRPSTQADRDVAAKRPRRGAIGSEMAE